MPKIGFQEIEALRRSGMTNVQIAELAGLTPARISQIRKEHGGDLSPRQKAMKHMPWETSQKYHSVSALRCARAHLVYMAAGQKELTDREVIALRNWYQMLEDYGVVLEFDPEIPPIVGVSKVGGFRYVKRTPEDEDFVIRVNDATTLTDEGDSLWRMPPKLPQV